MGKPLVSVIITTYSRPDNLKRAINSVLNQTYSNIEIIVVDDNGLNTINQRLSQKIVGEFQSSHSIVYIAHEVNRNGSAARNTGFLKSKGRYISFLDDDDEFCESKIEDQICILDNTDESIGACYCNMLFVGRNNTLIQTHNTKEGNLTEDVLLDRVRFNTSTILFKRESLIAVHGWDESFKRQQDLELMIRFFRLFNIKLAGKKPLVKRYHVGTTLVVMKDWVVPTREKYLSKYEQDILRLPTSNLIYQHHYLIIATYLFSVFHLMGGIRYCIKANRYKRIRLPQYAVMIYDSLKNYYKLVKSNVMKAYSHRFLF